MTREEAIHVVKSNWPEGRYMLSEALQTLIPELKESEDERIKKAIRYAIGQSTHSDGTLINGVSSEETLAWLEKKGEQKPAEKIEPKFKVGDKIVEKSFDECNTGIIKNIIDGKYIFDDGSYINIEEQELWQLVEQKPTDLPKGEDYGIDGLYHAVKILEQTLGDVYGYQTDDGILEHECAINAVKELYEQKHFKQSEKNEKIAQIKEQIALCNGFNRENRDKIFAMLDSLYS